MRVRWRFWRGWFHRKSKPVAKFRPRKYTIFFRVGGYRYYMIWDAWERADDGQWVVLTQEEIGLAFVLWAEAQGFRVVGRGDSDVGGIRGSEIEEYEVVDNSYFRLDI